MKNNFWYIYGWHFCAIWIFRMFLWRCWLGLVGEIKTKKYMVLKFQLKKQQWWVMQWTIKIFFSKNSQKNKNFMLLHFSHWTDSFFCKDWLKKRGKNRIKKKIENAFFYHDSVIFCVLRHFLHKKSSKCESNFDYKILSCQRKTNFYPF